MGDNEKDSELSDVGEDDDDEGVQKLRTLMEQDQEPTRGFRRYVVAIYSMLSISS